MGREERAHNVALGKAIRQLRKNAKLTQRELAERTGISVQELRQIEHGRVNADWGTVRHLGYVMETKLADVFRLTEGFEAEQSPTADEKRDEVRPQSPCA